MNTYIMIVSNSLYVTLMLNNIDPPFIIRYTIIMVNNVLRINCVDGVTCESHLLIVWWIDVQITLKLYVVFLYT